MMYCRYTAVLLFLLLANTLSVYGGDQTWQQRIERDDLAIDSWIRVSDPVDYDEQDSLRRELRVSLAYHRGDRTDLATAGDWNMTVIFTAYYADSTKSFTDTLLIEFAPGVGSHIYESVKWHTRREIGDVAYVVVDWVQIKYDVGAGLVTNNNPDWSVPQTIIPEDIHLTLAMTTVRLGQLNIYAPPLTGHRIEGESGETDWAVLYWKYVEGAEEYDLEFSWVDDKRTPAPSMSEVWSRATRIRTPKNHFDLPLAYQSGTIYYRVRPVGVHYTGHRLEPRIGNWSVAGSIAVDGIEVDPFEPAMSWQTQVQYAEAGKYKQLVTFYDRASRPRQVQTNLSTDSLVAVAEAKYDREGREALSIIPVPLVERNLRYKQSLNTVGSSAIGFADFDATPGAIASALDTTTGSGAYYSSQNALGPVRHGLNLTYIPSSRYPFSETEYTQDGTGRIRRQGGVGVDHQIGASGHATRYYYGTPSPTHLHRLFGTQVGDATHYQRNMVVDANGQSSITYLDMYGRTIATSLVGDAPANVQELARSSENIVVSLRVGDPIAALDDYVSRSENVILNEVPSSTYTFNYDLRGVLAADSPLDYCVDCQYALSIQVIGPDGIQLTNSHVTVVSSGTGTTVIATSGELVDTFSLGTTPVCTTTSYSPGAIVFEVDLDEIGEYRVLKTLTLLMDPIDEAIPGLSTYPDWDSAAIAASVDTTDCSWTCYESCVNYVEYLLAEGEVTLGTEYDNALDDCVEQNCTAAGLVEALADTLAAYECKALLEQIRIQVSPLGYLFEQDDWRDVVGAALAALPGTAYDDFDTYTYAEWVADFDDDLRDLLVLIHPEYCHYEHCLATLDTKAFDYLIAMQADWSAAITSGHLNPLLGVTTGNYAWSIHTLGSAQDPFGTTWSAAWVSLLTTALTSFYTDAGYGLMNLWQFLDATTPPGSVSWDAATTIYSGWDDGGGLSAGLQDSIEWQVFYGAYLGLKNQARAIRLEDDAYGDCPYWDDENAIVKRPILDGSPDAADSAMATLAGAACIGGCDDVVAYWLAQLDDCGLTATQYTELGSILFAACMDNCDGSSPYPIISSLDSAAGVLAGLEAYLDTAGVTVGCESAIWSVVVTPSSSLVYSDTLICFNQINACFSALLGFLSADVLPLDAVPPCSYYGTDDLALDALGCFDFHTDTSLFVGTSLILGEGQNCVPSLDTVCRLLDLYYYNDSVGGTGSIVQLAVEDIAEILDFHWQKLSTLDHTSSVLGPYTSSNIDATACSGACYTGYVARIKTLSDSVITVHMFGDNSCFTYTDGDSCKKIVLGFADPGDTTLQIVENDCLGEQILEAITLAEFEYAGEVAAFEDSVQRDYRNKCFTSPPFRELFSYSYESTEHHFTLYYYDQAGNLVQTVPPAGVATLSASSFVDTTGEYKSPYQEPAHRLQSSYAYDSRNLVIEQYSPDGGQTQFWYNDAGQLRYSQNAQQAIDEAFSFTCYDDLGRITVSGEVSDNAGDSIANGLSNTWAWLNDNSYPPRDWSSSSPAYAFSDVVTTTYDGADVEASIAQAHLRNRVSSTRVRQQALSSSALVTSAAFYSYDAHGNVDTLERRIRGLGAKKVAYRYDLLSGNVHEVAYQGDSADAFYHRYRYDADNRLLSVRTSQNKVIWSRDAEYYYYPHGPLARVEIGEDNLQGMDYYYTIHGWLKAVNTVGTIGGDTVFDPGADGYERIHRFVAGDELGYTLGYYKGDYWKIGRGSSTLAINRQESKAARQIWNLTDGLGNDVLPTGSGAKGLYNGNIAVLLSEIAPSLSGTGAWASDPLNGMAYQYDQLNRIKVATDYQWTPGGNVWGTSSTAYETEYAYDPNGNISSLKRNGLSGTSAVLLDDLTYTYDTGNDRDNRLLYVSDPQGEVISGVDLAGQSAGNYTYDAIGNLTKDVSAEIEEILWTTQGKIEAIERMTSSTEKDLRFTYDAFGNRTIKQAYTHGSVSDTTTYTTTFYVRDAQGNPLATYVRSPKVGSTGFDVDIEHPLYGSSRVGVRSIAGYKKTLKMDSSYQDNRTYASYELSNHLGNVLVTFQDLKVMDVSGGYVAEVNSVQDYYSFGMIMPGRNYNVGDYRYGWGSHEKVDEIKGSGNHYTAEFWEYDPRVVTRWNRDPVVKHDQSPYSILAGNPIWFIDPLGADSSLYNSGTGAFIAKGITPEDDKTAIWTVYTEAEGYDADNPWATATKLTYTVGKDSDLGYVEGSKLRKNHPLAGKGWKPGDQVFEEDLLNMTSEFNSLVNKWKPHFAQEGAEWDKAAQDWLDCWLCALNPNGYTNLILGKKSYFIGMVGPNMDFDLKSQSRGNLQQIPSYAAVIIGQYSFYNGRLMNYDDYGNTAFGAWGRAYGYGINTLTQGADIDQMFHTGSSDPGRDQYMIKLGFRLFK